MDALCRFGTDRPGGSTDPALARHIDGCPSCQGILDRLVAREMSADDAVVDPENLPRLPGLEMGRELGRGGMGVVFLARELRPDREVAVKFLSTGPFASARDRARWLKEARAAARVRHPHIVPLYRVDEADGWLYLVLEYVPGGSLKERLTGPLSPGVAAALLAPVARALEQLHLAGILHLDVKPANLLIDAPSGTSLDRAPLKLADFGIARSGEDGATTGTGLGAAPGTLPYMAPEQLAGRRAALGPAADIHAMGVILYELLTGRPPFLADTHAETIRRIQTEDPVPPRRLNPKVPCDLEVLCLTCLEKDPRRRYRSAGDLADDLGRWLEGHPISARPVPLVEKGWRWCRRRPGVAALLATLAMTLSAGFLVIFGLWREAEAARRRAEAAQRRAEADYEVGRAALVEILDLGERSLMAPVVVPRDRFVASLRSA
jgi:serine/threonine-protein kinase